MHIPAGVDRTNVSGSSWRRNTTIKFATRVVRLIEQSEFARSTTPDYSVSDPYRCVLVNIGREHPCSGCSILDGDFTAELYALLKVNRTLDIQSVTL